MRKQISGVATGVAIAVALSSLNAQAQGTGWLAEAKAAGVERGGKAAWPIDKGAAAVEKANVFVIAKRQGGGTSIDLTPAMDIEGGQLQIDLGQVGLPLGKYDIEISTLDGGGQMQELGRTVLEVTAAASTGAPAEKSIEPAEKRSSFTPKLELGVRSQLLERRNADAGPSSRPKYVDMVLDGGFETLNSGEDWEVKSSFSFSGSSYKNDAPMFATQGAKAPKVDLTNYLVEGGYKDTRFSAGNINVSTHPLLVQGISNRGVSVAGKLPLALDFNASIQNGGGAQAGIDNLLGVAQASNMFRQIGIGFDADPDKPGKARFDFTRVSARQLVGQLTTGGDAIEKSEGYGLRFSGRNNDGRGRSEISVATSLHNPAGGITTVDNRGFAWTAEVGYDLLKDAPMTPQLPVTFNVAARVEHSSPVYRSLGSAYGSNYRQYVGLFNLKVGPGQVQGQIVRRHDNVGADHNYIRNRVASWSLNGSFPLDQLVMAVFGKPAEQAPAEAKAQEKKEEEDNKKEEDKKDDKAQEVKPEEAKPEEAKAEVAKQEEPKAEEAKAPAAEAAKPEEKKDEEKKDEEKKDDDKKEEGKKEEEKKEDEKKEEDKKEEAKPAAPKPSPYWPMFTLSRKSVHGFGSPDFIPLGYTIDDLPDVVVVEHAWGLRWAFEKVQLGIKRATINTDNRQVGFTNESIQDTRWGYSLDYKATEALTIGASHDLSSNLRGVNGVIAEGFQSKLAVGYTFGSSSQINLELNRNLSRDTTLALNLQRSFQLQYSNKFKTPTFAGSPGLPAQFYVRLLGSNGLASQALGTSTMPRTYAVQLGITISFF